MNTNDLYLLGTFLCTGLVFISFIALFACKKSKKQQVLLSIMTMFWIINGIFFYAKECATYKEVYYLKYTVYYPGNTYVYVADSCNHVYISSDRGTNYLRYYSIPDKETYGIYTSAPIVINKITKK